LGSSRMPEVWSNSMHQDLKASFFEPLETGRRIGFGAGLGEEFFFESGEGGDSLNEYPWSDENLQVLSNFPQVADASDPWRFGDG